MIEKLRQRIQQLISAYETEKQERKRLESELEKSSMQNKAYREQILELERTIDNLKLADAFKSGNADNTEARKKIDKLIKEIDRCITLMEG
jgi:chromosome segregation ATPase